MRNYVVYGGSGHARVVLDLLISSGKTVTGILDDNSELDKVSQMNVETPDPYQNYENVIIAIGDNQIRKEIALRDHLKFAKAVVHHMAHKSESVNVGEGSVVMAGAVINADVRIGDHVIVNTNATIEHNCDIDSFVHISPGAILTGGVSIGEGSHVGAGAVVLPNVKVGNWVTIGAGAVILSDVPDNVTIVGNPGRIVKRK